MELRCPECGYKWNYRGKSKRATCPSCWRKVVVDNATAVDLDALLESNIRRCFSGAEIATLDVVGNDVFLKVGDFEFSMKNVDRESLVSVIHNILDIIRSAQLVEPFPEKAVKEAVDWAMGVEVYTWGNELYSRERFKIVQLEDGYRYEIPYIVRVQRSKKG